VAADALWVSLGIPRPPAVTVCALSCRRHLERSRHRI